MFPGAIFRFEEVKSTDFVLLKKLLLMSESKKQCLSYLMKDENAELYKIEQYEGNFPLKGPSHKYNKL